MSEALDETQLKWRTYFVRPGLKGIIAVEPTTGAMISEELDSRAKGAVQKEAALRRKMAATLVRRARVIMNQRTVK